MPVGNGGVIGPANIPTTSIARGVWSLKEAFLAQKQGIWPVPTYADPYFEYTTLLLPGNGTNGAQNNTFLDASTNNFTITRNGNTTQGTFSPFSQTGWSGSFNTSTTYLTVTDTSNLRFGSSNFTIEAFVYRAASGATQTIASKGASTPTGWVFQISSADKLVFTDTSTSITGATSLAANTWYYVAVVRAGTGSNQTTLYVNAVSDATGTSATTFSQTDNMKIGADRSNTNFANGYISNLRLSNTNRTISSTPTSALTADSNTIFLGLYNNRFQYTDSTAAFTNMTVTGTPSVQAFSPFNPTASWSAATYGGSGYFDGSGDYLNAGNQTALHLGAGDFTVEMWLWKNANTSYMTACGDYISATTNTFQILADVGGTKIGWYDGASGAFTITSSAAILINTWTHIAFVRSGSTLTLYINGVSDSTATLTTNLNATTSFYVGHTPELFAGRYWNGYISNLRLVKGTAVYTGAFTPPSLLPITNAGSTSAASYPSTTNVNTSFASSATSLLLNFTNAGIYDATSKNDLETLDNTVNGVRISTTQSKFGGSSIYFDGTGTDYLWIQADQPIQRFGTAPFTIEMWIRLAALGSARGLVAKGTSTTGWLVSLNTSNQVVFTYGTSTITSTGTISQNAWTYIAVVREGTSTNQTKIYIGGVNDGTGTVSTDFTQTSSMYIGANRTGGDLYSGYIQDVRITNGYARTVTTVPTSAFPTL
jgi:hypothetical protein